MIQSKKVKHDRDEMLIVNDKYSLNRLYILKKMAVMPQLN